MTNMNPEAAEAIKIAEKHLAGEPIARRKALAADIQEAIIRYAGLIANEVISEAFAKARNVAVPLVADDELSPCPTCSRPEYCLRMGECQAPTTDREG